jgi:N-acetylglucosaminyldiphosphoundecaprenol N-acetyl-beta-D-mannosaminyltransferase
VLVDRIDLVGAIQRVCGFVRSGRAHQVVTVNLDFVSIAQRNEAFRETLNQADLAVPDGMPLVWVSRLKGTPLIERVAGVDLFDLACAMAAAEGWRIFLLGAAPGVADKAAEALLDRYPALQVAGTYAPPMGELTAEEEETMLRVVNEVRPELLFVALGAPRQDLWIRTHLARLDVRLAMGVGCGFDLLAGAVARAPRWMQRCGLEWAFRLAQEPARLWRRYLLNDLPLLAHLLVTPGESIEPEGDGPGLVVPT